MAKASASKPSTRGGKQTENASKGSAERTKAVHRAVTSGPFVVSRARFKAVMLAAELSGLLKEKSGRIGGRVSPALVEQAKRQTGIETDTDLIQFALATVALEDSFSDAFKKSRGKVDPEVKLGF